MLITQRTFLVHLLIVSALVICATFFFHEKAFAEPVLLEENLEFSNEYVADDVLVYDETQAENTSQEQVSSFGTTLDNDVFKDEGESSIQNDVSAQTIESVTLNEIESAEQDEYASIPKTMMLRSASPATTATTATLASTSTPVAKTAVAPSATDKLALQNKNVLTNDHIYIITSKLSNTAALSAADNATTNRTNVDVETLHRGVSQQWRTSIDATGYVTFINVASGLALDAYGGVAKDTQNVWLYMPNGSVAQKWIVVSDATGLRIASALNTNIVLDLYKGLATSGTNVWMYSNTKTNDQRWNFYDLTKARLELDARAAASKKNLASGSYHIVAAKNLSTTLQPAGNTSGANVALKNAQGTAGEAYKITIDQQGYATVINTASGKALDVAQGRAVNFTNVWQYNANNSLAQKWVIEKNADGTYTFISALHPDMVLDIYNGKAASGTNVSLYTNNGTVAQKWLLLSTNPTMAKSITLTTNKWFTITPSANKSLAVDVYNASTTNKTNTWVYTDNDTPAQMFRFVSNGAGYYYIENAASGNMFDVAGGYIAQNANIQQYAKANTKNQLFSASRNSDGTYTFKNVATGLVLAVDATTPAKGTNVVVQILQGSPTAAQKFYVTVADNFLDEGIYSIFSNTSDTLAVDVLNGSSANNATMWLYTSNKTFAQKWYFAPTGAYNTYTIQSIRTGKYLTANSAGVVSQYPTNTANAQKWVLDMKAGQYFLKNLATGTYLDMKNNQEVLRNTVVVANANTNDSQKWNIAAAKPLEDGYYELMSALNSSFALDVYAASKNAGANVQLYTSNHTGAQKWKLTRNTDGSYTLRNAISNLALSPASISLLQGVNIQQSVYTGAAYQKWNVMWSNKGYFTLVNAANGNFVLAANGTTAANYTNVVVGNKATTPNRGWTFVATTYEAPSRFYLYLDAGHITGAGGGYDSGALGNGYKEADLTRELVTLIANNLTQQGIRVHTSIDDNLGFKDRMAKAASLGCTDLVSIHFNSGGGTGSESYIRITGGDSGSVALQDTLHSALVKSLGITNRGKKKEDYAITNGGKYGIPAVLLEIAFIDNASDMKIYQSKKASVAQALSNAIVSYADLGIQITPSASAVDLKTGAGVNIMGTSNVTAAQMVKLYNSRSVTYPTSIYKPLGAATITDFVNILIDEAKKEGVRADIVFAQAMNETGWLQFGGDVKAKQCNFAGLGATGNGVPGSSFSSVREGLRAQVQHLKAYATTASLNQTCVDPRFNFVSRGSGPTVAKLSMKWAMTPDYGKRIMAIVNEL